MPRKSNKPSTDYTFEELDKDLTELDALLKESNVTTQERLELFKPITSKTESDKTYWLMEIGSLLVFLLVAYVVYTFFWEELSWHVTAVTRIIMIKLLPYFDWRYLKHEECLIPKLTGPTPIVPPELFDCDLCESLKDFDYFSVHSNSEDLRDIVEKYIEVEKPLIVAGAIDHWLKKSPLEFIDQMMDKEEFSNSIPCNLYTNLHNFKKGDIDMIPLLEKTSFFDSFFMHFQNCDADAMRVFRNYTYRPAILPQEISPVTLNWLVWNKNYNTPKYKLIPLVEKVTVIGQMFGSTRLRLVPRKNCQDVCPILEEVLPAGYIMILTSLWDVEYMPEGEGDNMAAILEVRG